MNMVGKVFEKHVHGIVRKRTKQAEIGWPIFSKCHAELVETTFASEFSILLLRINALKFILNCIFVFLIGLKNISGLAAENALHRFAFLDGHSIDITETRGLGAALIHLAQKSVHICHISTCMGAMKLDSNLNGVSMVRSCFYSKSIVRECPKDQTKTS